MLVETADGVLVRQSAFCLSNAAAIVGERGVLLVDPGVDGDDLAELAAELRARRLPVVAGFSTHPHWDHLLWHPAFGGVPRYGTWRCVRTAVEELADARDKAARFAPGAAADLVGGLVPLPEHSDHVPWDGPPVRVIEHSGHAAGHAALLVESSGVLLAGDMLSDVEIPLLDLRSGAAPLADYVEGLDRLAAVIAGLTAVVPGHGAVGRGDEIIARIDRDRAYLRALRSGSGADDPRLAPDAGYVADWLPGDHQRQVRATRGAR